MRVPFFRFEYDPDALCGIEECLRSGWLTTGGKAKEFEKLFGDFVSDGQELHAVALNSCTAALHLALDAVGLSRGDLVLTPTHTFAATAEVVRYFDATPVLVDSDPYNLNITAEALATALERITSGKSDPGFHTNGPVKAVIPVHYGGQPADMHGINEVAKRFGIDVIEDAAHAFPAGWVVGERGHVRSEENEEGKGKREEGKEKDERRKEKGEGSKRNDEEGKGRREEGKRKIRYVGAGTSRVTCFSFYANKTITTGEGGMAVTEDAELAARIRLMSLHGMNKDAWKRFSSSGSWDYEIVAPGFKYNMTDIAAAIGLTQLAKAEEMRLARERVCHLYDEAFSGMEELELIVTREGILHSRHLYVIKLRLDMLRIDRAEFIEQMKARGVMCSVHWRPLHMHPYYRDLYGYKPADFPVAAAIWPRIVSLPLFPSMTDDEISYVIESVTEVIARNRK